MRSLLGLGAMLNGACVIGSIARLGSGDLAFAAMPVGYYLGCVTCRPAVRTARAAGAGCGCARLRCARLAAGAVRAAGGRAARTGASGAPRVAAAALVAACGHRGDRPGLPVPAAARRCLELHRSARRPGAHHGPSRHGTGPGGTCTDRCRPAGGGVGRRLLDRSTSAPAGDGLRRGALLGRRCVDGLGQPAHPGWKRRPGADRHAAAVALCLGRIRHHVHDGGRGALVELAPGRRRRASLR